MRGLLAGLLRAINKCRCQHPPLDPRLSHVSSSPSLAPFLSPFSVRPLSPSFFPPFPPSSLTCTLLHGAPRSSFPSLARYNSLEREKKGVRVYLRIPVRSCTQSPRERATGDSDSEMTDTTAENVCAVLYPRLGNGVAVRKRAARCSIDFLALRGGEGKPIFARTREKLKGSVVKTRVKLIIRKAYHLNTQSYLNGT